MDSEIRKLTKRTLLVTVCLLMMLSPLYAAPHGAQATAQGEPRYGGTLRIAYGSDVIGWNPISNYWSTSMYYFVNVFSKPYQFDDLYNIVGDAMQAYPTVTSEGGQTVYSMELQHNIKWHDGTPMTAEDILFTFETLAWGAQNKPGIPDEINNRLEIPAYMSSIHYGTLTKIELEGDYKIKFYFDGVQLDTWLSEMNTNCILPKHLWEDFNKNNPAGETFEDNQYNDIPVGTGPYKVIEHVRDQYVIMERFDDYHYGIPYLEYLVWNIITDPTAAMLALENGEVDTVHEQLNFPQAEITRVNSDPRFSVDAFPYTTTWRVTWNFHPDSLARWPWVDDVEVRKAMEYAIDKQTICDNVLFGITKPTSTILSWIVAPYGGDYNSVEQGYTGDWPIEFRDYNPDKARQILDDAGWVLNKDGVREKDGVTITGVQGPYYHYATAWCEAITGYWEEIGIFVEPVPLESTTFFEGIEVTQLGLESPEVGGPYPLGFNTMGGGPDPDDVRYWTMTRGEWVGRYLTGPDNFGFYGNARVDELFDLGKSTAIYKERKAYYDELQYLVHEDVGYIMLWNKWKIEAWNNDFMGFGSNRPIAWYGRYFRGTDDSSNVDRGVYWRGGSDTPYPETPVTTIISQVTQVTTVVPEFMSLRVLVSFALLLFTSILTYRRRRREK